MDLTSNVADFTLLPKHMQEHGKTMSIYHYFKLYDTLFKPKYFFISEIYEFSSESV